jgi:hypothetical protein
MAGLAVPASSRFAGSKSVKNDKDDSAMQTHVTLFIVLEYRSRIKVFT